MADDCDASVSLIFRINYTTKSCKYIPTLGTEVGADYHMASATPAGGGDYYDMGGAADYHMATATPIERVETNA